MNTTTPRLYIASRTRHGARWVALRDLGVPFSSTWINEYVPGGSPSIADLWTRCVSEAASATKLYAYIESDSLEGGLVEIGAALGAGVPVVVVCTFAVWETLGSWKRHPLVQHDDSGIDLLEAKAQERNGRG